MSCNKPLYLTHYHDFYTTQQDIYFTISEKGKKAKAIASTATPSEPESVQGKLF